MSHTGIGRIIWHLKVHGGIPIRFIENDGVGRGQVDAQTAGACAAEQKPKESKLQTQYNHKFSEDSLGK